MSGTYEIEEGVIIINWYQIKGEVGDVTSPEDEYPEYESYIKIEENLDEEEEIYAEYVNLPNNIEDSWPKIHLDYLQLLLYVQYELTSSGNLCKKLLIQIILLLALYTHRKLLLKHYIFPQCLHTILPS